MRAQSCNYDESQKKIQHNREGKYSYYLISNVESIIGTHSYNEKGRKNRKCEDKTGDSSVHAVANDSSQNLDHNKIKPLLMRI